MNTSPDARAVHAAWRLSTWACLRLLLAGLLWATCWVSPAWAGDLRVLKTGIGTGTITVTGTSISDCADVCSSAFTDDVELTFRATAPAGHRFLRWEGSVTGTDNPASATLRGEHRVRAVFGLLNPASGAALEEIRSFAPGDLRDYFRRHPYINTPARFLAVLPRSFRQNWILMTRSESLQTGTALSPRLLIPDATGKFVFTIGLGIHRSYPGSHPLAVEYMQWDEDMKNFRFHEIILGDIDPMEAHRGVVAFAARPRMGGPNGDFISIDDAKCFACHSTRNVMNRTGSPGTASPEGASGTVVQFKSKPNWDTYDSWAGMLAFNRDRIYQGSVEAAAFRYLFNPWNWEALPAYREVMELLELQPPGVDPQDQISRIQGGPNDGRIVFAFDPVAARPVLREPAPDEALPTVNTEYRFDGTRMAPATRVARNGNRVTLRHSTLETGPDEGRGVRLFDLLGGLNPAGANLNALRVADELVNHQYITGSHRFDIRPIALAVARRYLRIDTVRNVVVDSVPGVDLNPRADFFGPRHGTVPSPRTITEVFRDTRARAFGLTRRKADLQFINLSRHEDPYLYKPRNPMAANPPAPAPGLLREYGSLATFAPTFTRFDSTRREVFRRAIDLGFPDRTIMGGVYVDREDSIVGYPTVDYSPRRVAWIDNTHMMALFRYYLEPLGVSVDKWNISVRGRSRTYTFADVMMRFLSTLDAELTASLRTRPIYSMDLGRDLNPADPADVIRAVNITFSDLPRADDTPTFTDVQRIFNKSCIECHGGLEYPPYSNYTFGRVGSIILSEDERMGRPRLERSHAVISSNPMYFLDLVGRTSEVLDISTGMMPWGGPAISQCDVETIRRWIVGGSMLTVGDPHLVTIDGTAYDFQAAGEYVLLRGDFFELQARHKAIYSAGPLGPNAHTGLSTCVSVNTGVAVLISGRRITYLPPLANDQDGSKLELRLDGSLTELPAEGLSIAPGTRIVRDGSPHGIRIEGPGGTSISIAASFWEGYRTWILNVHAQRLRGREGLMGGLATGSWLPALPDGSSVGPIPKDLNARYKVLYGTFGPAWSVTDSSSLFDYAPGKSTTNYGLPTWPQGESPDVCAVPQDPSVPPAPNGMDRAAAEKACMVVGDARLRDFCIQDLMATGATAMVDIYQSTDRVLRNRPPVQPQLRFPANGARDIRLPIDFQWEASTDPDNEAVTYRHLVWPVTDLPDTNLAAPVGQRNQNARRCGLIALLIGTGIWLLLYLLLRKRLSKLVMFLLFLLVVLAAWLAYYLCGRNTEAPTHREIAELPSGMAYNWKIIAEDGKGGISESETFRFELP